MSHLDQKQQQGYSLLELMIAAGIFLVLCGAAFGLLNACQKNYSNESQVLNAFQDARFGIDQIVRDVNDSGYPPLGNFLPPVPSGNANLYAITPVAWSPNYPGATCTIGVSCLTPGDFDLIIETNINPQDDNDVEWIRYQLQGTTLYRGMVGKVAVGGDPDNSTKSVLVPYIQNVVNNVSADQIVQFQANYPQMFPGGQPVPIFSYACDTAAGPQLCSSAGSSNSPINIRDVQVTLIVMAPSLDAQTGRVRLVELNGRGHRVNPMQ